MDKGYVKYHCIWIKSAPVSGKELTFMNEWRQKLFNLGLIGSDKHNVGFGNISIRMGNSSKFLITGTQTGRLSSLNECHYTLVVDFDFTNNRLTCLGPIQSSSESLTHAAVYSCRTDINSVIHVHNHKLWKNLIHKKPSTSLNVKYGTPEMAYEIMKLINEKHIDTYQDNIFAMLGHEDGIISFGSNLAEAGNLILDYASSPHAL